MKAIAWMRYLSEQRDLHDKHLFTVTELANVAATSPAVMNVELSRLIQRGVLRRWTTGRYGLPGDVPPGVLVSSIDPDAYATGAWALGYHGFITQQPYEMDCFTRRRHNRSRRRSTPLGSLVFVTVSPRLHSVPAQAGIAPPDQALCDLFYVARRRGLAPKSLYTFRKLDSLNLGSDLLARYPKTVQRDVEELCAG